MIFGLSESLRGRRLALIASDLDAAATPGLVRLYGAPQPSIGGAVTSQVLQATVPLADPSATLAGTVLTFAPAADGVRVAGDPITWARFVDGDGVFVADGDATLVGGGGFVLLAAVTGPIGSLIRVMSGTLSE